MKIATVCSGIGSPEVALKNLGINHSITFACEIDKYARETYLANHNTEMMYQDMTAESWEGEKYYADLMIGGIPCQSFSLAGKRLGELDPRGLLFFDFLRYVKNQTPKYFIIENVKGLLSDNNGETFRNWIQLLGQSENGNTFMFPHEDSLMYNLHWQVLNTKDYGLPQNRERVFLVGIRNDLPNDFNFPKTIPLKLRLKDILEDEVDEKYYLSEKMINGFLNKGNGFEKCFKPKNSESILANCITTSPTDNVSANYIECIGNVNPSGNGMNGNVFSDEGLCPTLTTNKGEGVKVMIGAMRGRNLENPSDRTPGEPTQQMLEINENGTSNCLTSVQKDNLVVEGIIQLNNPKHSNDRIYSDEGLSPTLNTMQGGNRQPFIAQYTGIAVHPLSKKLEFDGFKDGNSLALLATDYKAPKCVQYSDYRIRKLTVRECARLQGFPESFDLSKVSNSQCYKQMGNTISVNVIQAILKNLLK